MEAQSALNNPVYSDDNFSSINRSPYNLNLISNCNLLNQARPRTVPNQSFICHDYNQPDYGVHECSKCCKPFTATQALGGHQNALPHKRFLPEMNDQSVESSNNGKKKLRCIENEHSFEVVHENQINPTPSDYKGKSLLITENVDPRRLHVKYNHLTDRIHLGQMRDPDTIYAPKPIRASRLANYNQFFTNPIYQNYLLPTSNSKIPILESSSSQVPQAPPPPSPSPINWPNYLPAKRANPEEGVELERPSESMFFMAEPNFEPFLPPGFGAHLGASKEFSPVYRKRVDGTPTTEFVFFPLCPESPPLGRQNAARVKPYAASIKRYGVQKPRSERLDLELRL